MLATNSVPIRIASMALGCVLGMHVAGASTNLFDTRHNLAAESSQETSNFSRGGLRRVADTAQEQDLADAVTYTSRVCAFCHTPYGEGGATPSWQRSTADDPRAFETYASFGSSTRENVAELGSVSIACMSCHDGTQAVNVTGNPFRVPSPHGLGSGGLPEARITERPPTHVALSAGHPVGIPYVGDAPGSRRELATSLTRGSLAEREYRLGFRTADSALINGVTVWWIETGNPGRQRTDIHLFSRNREDGTSEPYVECSSCHDPHTESRMFLRHAEPDDSICVTCHAM